MSEEKLVIDPNKPIADGDLCPFISNMAVSMAKASIPGMVAPPQMMPVSIAAPAPCAREACRLWLAEAEDCSIRQIARFSLGTLGLTEAIARQGHQVDTEAAIADAERSLEQATFANKQREQQEQAAEQSEDDKPDAPASSDVIALP